jgi:S-formylglutathione hydrolase FrmB
MTIRERRTALLFRVFCGKLSLASCPEKMTAPRRWAQGICPVCLSRNDLKGRYSAMAHFTVQYYSNALRRSTLFQAWIPNDRRSEIPRTADGKERPMKTLFALHGFTGSSENWVSQELMEQYNLAVVSATAENSFYLDTEATGHQYETMLAIELVDYVRKTFGLAMKPEDTYIAGISMGGFGAVHTALDHPERFSKIGMLSAALIVNGLQGKKDGDFAEDSMANYAYYAHCFGDLQTVAQRDTNPEVLLKKLKARGTAIPKVFQCIGTEDFLLEPNREFHRFLEEEGVPHVYHESKGGHDNVFWQEYVPKMVHWLFEDQK